MNRWERVGLAAALFLGLVALVASMGGQGPGTGISVQGVTNFDSLTLRDNLIVGKATTLGSGGIGVTGNISLSNGNLINTKGAVTVTDQLYVTSQMSGANGLAVTGNVTVTGPASFSSQVTASNGVAATGNITVGTDLDVAGNIVSTSGSVRVNDNTLITGTFGLTGASTLIGNLDMQGIVADSANSLRINDNTLVTGTLGVSSQINAGNGVAVTGNITGTDLDLAGNAFSTSGSFRINDNVLITGTLDASSQINAANGVAATGNVTVTGDIVMAGGHNLWDDAGDVTILDDVNINGDLDVDEQLIASNGIAAVGGITNTGNLSVTAWSFLSGLVGEVSSTQAITANYGITPTDQLIVYISDDGGQASDTVTLDASVSIVNGSYVGQLLIVVYVDTDGATMTIKDNANVQLPSNTDLVLGLNDSAWFLWNGTDWICIASTNV